MSGTRPRPRPSPPPTVPTSRERHLLAAVLSRELRRKASGVVLGLVTQGGFCIYGHRHSFSPARRGTVNREHCREFNCIVEVINRRNGTRVFYSLVKHFLA